MVARTSKHVKLNDTVSLSAFGSDGSCYRRWTVIVETLEQDFFSLVAPAGSRVWDVRGGWVQENSIRACCWPGEPYVLNEAYKPDGGLSMIYVNINSPIEISGSQLSYTDYELDAVLRPSQRAKIVDEGGVRRGGRSVCLPAKLPAVLL